MKVLVTGATGFVGKKLCEEMFSAGMEVLGTVRSSEQIAKLPTGVKPVLIRSINSETDWTGILENVDVVIHLAARVHIKKETAIDPLSEFRKINTEGTIRLASAAASAGVKRFVFMSTIGVNGKSSGLKAYTEEDTPAPHNMYSISKREAEVKLAEIASQSEMVVVSLRSPLLYGQGDPGNFYTLLKAVSMGIPLPVASIENRKSFLYVGNLVSALMTCAVHPSASGIYLVSDGEDISTAKLIAQIASEFKRPSRLFSFPLFLTRTAAKCIGKLSSIDQLVSTLIVDNSKIRRELNWQPPYTMKEALKETVAWFIHKEKSK